MTNRATSQNVRDLTRSREEHTRQCELAEQLFQQTIGERDRAVTTVGGLQAIVETLTVNQNNGLLDDADFRRLAGDELARCLEMLAKAGFRKDDSE